MTALRRPLISAMVGLVLITLAGCSGSPSGAKPAPEKGGALQSFDPCSFLSPEDLSAAGVRGPGKKKDSFAHEPGCSYEGQNILLAVYKNQQETVAKYEKDGSWDKYEKFDLNGRNAARAVEAGGASVDAGCSVVVDSGGGVVLVDVTEATPGSVPDKCGEAEKIARQIEPKLPK